MVEAVKAGRRRIFEIYVAADRGAARLAPLRAMAEKGSIPVTALDRVQLVSMAGTESHQGIAARVSGYPFADLPDLMDASLADAAGCLWLLLDSIVDPNNLGALARTALCAGVQAMVIPKDRSAPPTPAVSKASAGALEHLRLARVANLVNTLRTLKKRGVWIAGTDRAAEKSIYASDLTGPLAVVIGGEEKGLRPLVKSHCDFLMTIPQKGPLNSLNASAAGAVVLYEAFRQRMGPNPFFRR